MKRFLSLLLILCLCLGMLAACDEPSSGPSGIPPTEGDGGEGGGTSTTPPAGDGGAEGGTTTTPDSGNGGSTNPGGGNGSGPSGTLPGGGESGGTLPGGGNNGNGNNNAGDIIQPPAGEGRTTVTEMEFEAAKDTPKNYTQVLELKTASGTAYGAQVRYVATQNGKTTFYEWGEANGSTSGKCAFFRNGTYWGGDYDQESGKWTVYAGGSYSLALPFSGMPYAFSDFTYDEANGEYYLDMPEASALLTPEQIAAGAARITMRFSDGKCVYFRMAKSVIETGDILFAVYTFGNFGTTTPPIPPEADLIFAGNSANGTNPDFGGTTGGGGGYTPGDPPPHDPDNGNNNNNNHEDKDNDKDGDGIDDSQQTETVKRVLVYKSDNKHYHMIEDCSGIKEDAREMTQKQAEHEGFAPCPECC